MKAILLPIHPKWVAKIVRGEKEYDVRKLAPTLKTPFWVYMYETKTGGGSGKVVGTFVCDETKRWIQLPHPFKDKQVYWIDKKDLIKTCLTFEEIENYGKGAVVYGWHITNVQVYNKPRKISEFRKPLPCIPGDCIDCSMFDAENTKCSAVERFRLKKAPQNFQVIEV